VLSISTTPCPTGLTDWDVGSSKAVLCLLHCLPFVDDLVYVFKDEDKGVVFGDSLLTPLLYADDIVLANSSK